MSILSFCFESCLNLIETKYVQNTNSLACQARGTPIHVYICPLDGKHFGKKLNICLITFVFPKVWSGLKTGIPIFKLQGFCSSVCARTCLYKNALPTEKSTEIQ